MKQCPRENCLTTIFNDQALCVYHECSALRAEVERLKEENANLYCQVDYEKHYLAKATAEVEWLKGELHHAQQAILTEGMEVNRLIVINQQHCTQIKRLQEGMARLRGDEKEQVDEHTELSEE